MEAPSRKKRKVLREALVLASPVTPTPPVLSPILQIDNNLEVSHGPTPEPPNLSVYVPETPDDQNVSCPISGEPNTPEIPAPIMSLIPSIDESVVTDVHDIGIQCKAATKDCESMTTSPPSTECKSTNIRPSEGSYDRENKDNRITYSWLIKNVVISKDHTINWLFANGLLAKERQCPVCNSDMKLVRVKKEKTSDEHMWRCQKKVALHTI